MTASLRSFARGAVLVWLVAAGACGDDGGKHGAIDSGTPSADAAVAPTLMISPANATVTIINGVAVGEAYTATLVLPDGTSSDVTALTTFTLADPTYGNWTGPALSVTGQGAGPVVVTGTAAGAGETVVGTAMLTVNVKVVRIEGAAPTTAPTTFGSATEDASTAPTIIYPADSILVPPNLGQFDVHWSDGSNDTFEIEMANEYVDIQIYTDGLYLGQQAGENDPFWTLFQPSDWDPIASSREQLTLSVIGLSSATPTVKGTAATQHVNVTNENAKGGIYYWTPTLATVLRYDIAHPETPPAPLFAAGPPDGCIGCHTLSRDGTKIAMTVGNGYGPGAVYNVADQSELVAWDGGSDGMQPEQNWNFATFTPDGTKLVTAYSGQMQLIDVTNAGAQLAMLDNSASMYATHPDFSPDGTQLANVEHADSADYYAYGTSIVTRSFDNTTNTFGEPTPLVAYDATNAPDTFSYYPSYSPDGKWIAFSRSTDGSYVYNNATAETWVVKADGSAPPIRLDAANSVLGQPDFASPTNSWARWVPFAQTFGPTNETLFYLTFSTERPFGVRLPANTRPQIWMTPFFPDRALAGNDPSGPAFRVPFQAISTGNHIAQWTNEIVIE